jgi:hypothetical protein
MKEQLIDKLDFHGNYFDIKNNDDYTEQDLLNHIINIHSNKI